MNWMKKYLTIKKAKFSFIFSFLIIWSITASGAGTIAVHVNQLKAFYRSAPPQCLGEKEWPISTTIYQAVWEKGRLLALVDAGLAEITTHGVKRYYNLTPLGQKNFERFGDLCYGRLAVNSIKKIETTKRGITEVYFTLHLIALENWATDNALRSAFSELDLLIAGADSTLYRAIFVNPVGQRPALQGIPEPVELEY